MTKTEAKPVAESVNALFSNRPDGLREIVRAVMQEMLEAEMMDVLGAEKGERSAARLGYRSGYYSRTLVRHNDQVDSTGQRSPGPSSAHWHRERSNFIKVAKGRRSPQRISLKASHGVSQSRLTLHAFPS